MWTLIGCGSEYLMVLHGLSNGEDVTFHVSLSSWVDMALHLSLSLGGD